MRIEGGRGVVRDKEKNEIGGSVGVMIEVGAKNEGGGRVKDSEIKEKIDVER